MMINAIYANDAKYANMRIMRFAFRILFEKKEKTKKARKESNIKKRRKEKKD